VVVGAYNLSDDGIRREEKQRKKKEEKTRVCTNYIIRNKMYTLIPFLTVFGNLKTSISSAPVVQ